MSSMRLPYQQASLEEGLLLVISPGGSLRGGLGESKWEAGEILLFEVVIFYRLCGYCGVSMWHDMPRPRRCHAR